MSIPLKQKTAEFLELLPIFDAVAKTGSLRDGARMLGVSAATASNRLRRLEDVLSVNLFLRTRRSLALTDDGTLLLRDSERWLGEAERYLSARLENESRVLQVGAMGTVDDWLLLPALRDAQLGGVPLSMSISHPDEGDVGAPLLRGVYDLFVGVNLVVPFDVRRELLGHTTLGIYVGRHHPLYGVSSVSVDEVLTYGFVVQSGQPLISPVWPKSVNRTLSLFVDTYQGAVDACRTGRLNIALLDIAMERDIGNGDLYRLPIELDVRCDIVLCWHEKQELTPALKCYVAQLHKRMRTLMRKNPTAPS